MCQVLFLLFVNINFKELFAFVKKGLQS